MVHRRVWHEGSTGREVVFGKFIEIKGLIVLRSGFSKKPLGGRHRARVAAREMRTGTDSPAAYRLSYYCESRVFAAREMKTAWRILRAEFLGGPYGTF